MAARKKTGGRSKGTPNKATSELREAAQKYTVKCLAILFDIAKNSESDSARVSATNSIFDRGHGKPSQTLEASIVQKTHEQWLEEIANED